MRQRSGTARTFAWLPFRWAEFWCRVGLHNPVYTFDHERGEPEYRCFWCGRLT